MFDLSQAASKYITLQQQNHGGMIGRREHAVLDLSQAASKYITLQQQNHGGVIGEEGACSA